ncbi:ERCC4 domain-containing protein [Halapricum desulfuricans]|uniref:ERCC4-type nuclease n=1 Tax=Halapricum desulfuricans TaxID=2841257 RepID=A0A897N5U4_9EURY|nr:ERCC4 domain-containing protein [Halapricum desulfuricans]QSG06355.1 ERCC4-type nuclease [Halapricum desulfuricans]
MIIVVDQREKKPFDFPGVETKEAHLETGDYTVEGFEDRFAVERKSIDDLTKSVGSDRNRFEAEIRRAQAFDEFAVVIEGSREDIEDHNYFSMIHPNAVLGTTEKWPWKYDRLEFIWAGEDEEGNRIYDLAEAKEQAAQQTLRLLDRWYLKAASDLF